MRKIPTVGRKHIAFAGVFSLSLMLAGAEGAPMQCNTKSSKSPNPITCDSSGGDFCLEDQSDFYIFCTATEDSVACWRTPVEPFVENYNRREGECVGGTCIWGPWEPVTTTFDHTVQTDECSGYW